MRSGKVAYLRLPTPTSHGASSRVPQAPFCHLGFQNANCPSGNWLIGQGGNWPIVHAVCASDSTRRRLQAKRSLWRPSPVPAPPREDLARRHELATHDRRDSTSTVRPPIHREKTLASAGPADKIRDGGAIALSSRSPPHPRHSP